MTARATAAPAIGIFGAGSIGCYLGGRLAAAGGAVRLVGRAHMAEVVARHGLRVSDWQGYDHVLAPRQVPFSTEAAALATAELVLVTVKSADTEMSGDVLASVLAPGTVVISLQNGVNNAARLQQRLPRQRVLAGMVPFNVVQHGDGHFHHGSEGVVEVEADNALTPWLDLFRSAGLPLQLRADMNAVLWAKLLLNLNNPINALAGIPLQEELRQRAFRRCIALAQREALALYAEAGIRPARLTPVPPRWMPSLLAVPDAVFQRVGQRMLRIDPLARSSMWEDLERGRRTEIEWINGELLHLAERLGRKAPVNACLVALVRAAEQGGRRDWSGPELLAALQRAAQD
ncbi:2-dehydropantoate 2-reductase [Algiphilus sp.]|uniref:2-dehydropantoate 2-reductase n=1 Tax=Algiphilus sp. TaxID=1872431 RepID=UPI002A5F0698|nr:2-dehydropantoate 2-reductase [Pseudomonadota bacterium]